MNWIKCGRCGEEAGAESPFEARKLLGTHECNDMQSIGLEDAMFCVNCEVVFSWHDTCPKCDRPNAIVPLTKWLEPKAKAVFRAGKRKNQELSKNRERVVVPQALSWW